MAKIENNTSNTKKIMVVDDETDVISVLEIVLEENGFEVDTFEDPIVALKSYRAGLYDLLILDIKMPEMDGFELYDRIKKIDDNAKVCFLTASEMYYKNSRKIYKDFLIQKPIANEDLVEEINKILSESNNERS
jgi:DNA-binding response OmpR family regulator